MNGRKRGSRREDLQVKAEINITSLVDVAFTLLVIFIIIAPTLQGGVEVEVPEAEVQPLTSEEEPFMVTIDRQGRVYIGETEVDPDELATSLPQLLRASQVEMVYIKGDSLANYGRVLNVIAAVARSEGVDFGLVAEPPPNGPEP